MGVIGRAWRCETCLRLWPSMKHPGQSHDHVDGIVVCRGRVVEVEVVPYPDHSGAVEENERLRLALRDLKGLMPAIQANARGVIERVDQELAPDTGGQ